LEIIALLDYLNT